MADSVDVVVVGGGIIGLAVAREAALAGLRVVLLEKGRPGCEASSAAAGMLSPQADAERTDPLLSLCLASRDLYPEFAGRVASESGVDPCLADHGTIIVARDRAEADRLRRMQVFQRAAGLTAELLDAGDALRLEPSLSETTTAALFLPRDPSIDNVLLVRALAVAAERAGARLRLGTAVTRLLVDRSRIVGVEAGGERFHGASIVLAAGAWTGLIEGDGVAPVASHPVRGQMKSVRASAPRHVVVGGDCYLVPRRDGRLLIGSTMERVGFDRRVTPDAIAALTAAACDLVPGLRQAPRLETWAGLRPATDDDSPAIGFGALPGLLYAFGHLRNGILLAPITARIVVHLLRGEDPEVDLSAFNPLRFVRGGRRVDAPRR